MKYLFTTILLVLLLQASAQSWVEQIKPALNRGEVNLIFNNQAQEQKLLDYVNSYRRLHLNHTSLIQDSLITNAVSKNVFTQTFNKKHIDSLNSKVFVTHYSNQVINQIYYSQHDHLTTRLTNLNDELLNHIYVQCMSNAMYNWIDNENQNKLLTKNNNSVSTASKLKLKIIKQGDAITIYWSYLGSFSASHQGQELLAVHKNNTGENLRSK